MKIAYFDCFSGLSGDMALGALLDCGVPIEALRDGLRSLPVSDWTLDAQPVLQSGIHALSVSIALHGETDEAELARVRASDHAHDHHHDHDHHEHSHGHAHDHHHNHSPHTTHHHGRSMREIRELIEGSALSERVKRDALRVFGHIAEAEAFLHHATPDDVHFHEIGGVDSLLDICGVAWCLEYLGVEQVYFSPLPLGSGWVDCAHGKMPVPAPATLRLLQGAPIVPSDIKSELVTPTGAGFVRAFGGMRRWGIVSFDTAAGDTLELSTFKMPPMVPQQVGHGAGKKRFPDRPNFVRVTIGEELQRESAPLVVVPSTSVWDLRNIEVGEVEAAPDGELSELEIAPTPDAAAGDGLEWRTLELWESNVDDMNPEAWGYVLERVLEAGALDAWLEPIQMKKSRPAHKLCALCDSDARGKVLATILRETTTLGVRGSRVRRASLPRQIETVTTPYGEARVKIAFWPNGGVARRVPEWDDVARIAREHNISTHVVYEAVRNGVILADGYLALDER